MKNISLLIFVFIAFNIIVKGQKNTVKNEATYRVINIGNVVDIENPNAYFNALKQLIEKHNEPTLVLLNGDIIKKNKQIFLGEDSARVVKILTILSNIKNSRTIVLQGDRDWDNSGKRGREKIKNLEKLVEHNSFKNVKWVLDKGCPGPEIIELDSNLLLMTINTQWWNHPHDKPAPVDGDCKIINEKDFVIEFENGLLEADEKHLIIAGHFPLIEQGTPTLKNYILPLPVAGSLITSFHQNIGGKKDIVNSRFNKIRKTMLNRISVKKGVVYLSGHSRNTQIVKQLDNYFINNGLPVSLRKTRHLKHNVYASTQPGITELLYHKNGKITTNNYQFKNDVFQNDTSIVLFQQLQKRKAIALKSDYNFIPLNMSKDTINTPKVQLVQAGNYEMPKFTQLFLGKHYRKSWNTPIEVPVLNMDTTKGGLYGYALGGGHQTTAIKMYGKDERAYTFRSVDKDATKTLHFLLKKTVVADIMQDNVAMQHPYGGLIVSSLLDNTSILHAKPTLYVLPDSEKLGDFNEYCTLFGMLEEHPKKSKKVRHIFANANDILQSHQLNDKLYKTHKNKVDAKEYTQARVFDILVGDYGKHPDNWKWAKFKTDSFNVFRPIPRDRDLVFAQWDGLFPWFLDRKWALESGENFGYKINDIKSLMFVARHQDRLLTNQMTKNDWLNASKSIQNEIDSLAINKAVKSLPNEIYELSGKTIADKLNTRIKDLDTYTLAYYKLLAKRVDVVGSNKKEYFKVDRNTDGSVEVNIYAIEKKSDTIKGDKAFYQRIFYPSETKEIRLYGLGGKDVFNVSGAAKKSIKIIVVGGDDADYITDNSSVKSWGRQTKVYENNTESSLNLGKEAKKMNTWKLDLYDFRPNAFQYNRYLPLASVSYSADNGFGVGGGVELTNRENFKNIDFSSKHKFNMHITTEKNNVFTYQSIIRHAVYKWDLQVGSLIANHNDFTNFFGIGNNTAKNDSLFDAEYYKTTYNSYSGNIGLIRTFWKKSRFNINTELQRNKSQIDKNTIVYDIAEESTALVYGTADNTVFVSSAELDLDFRDRSYLPEKGVRFYANYKKGVILQNGSNYYTSEGYFQHYFSIYAPTPITLNLKVGGALNRGEIPFYNRTYLGNSNNLRGYKKNRFTGDALAFANADLRVELLNFSAHYIPMKIGAKLFCDVGRVYSDFDTSNKLHNGYGAGIYWVFYNEQYTFDLSVAHSEEEKHAIIFSLGTFF